MRFLFVLDKVGQTYLHHIPRTVADTDDDDRQRILTGLHDSTSGGTLVSYLTVGDDDKDMVLKKYVLRISSTSSVNVVRSRHSLSDRSPLLDR